MRIALYLRVSTDKQETENQALQLREFCARQNCQTVHEYCDYVSGGKCDRAEFQRMFEDASRRKFDLLLFWALDRLSREGVLETLQHLNRLTAYEWRHSPNRSASSDLNAHGQVWRVLERLARPSGGLGCSTAITLPELPRCVLRGYRRGPLAVSLAFPITPFAGWLQDKRRNVGSASLVATRSCGGAFYVFGREISERLGRGFRLVYVVNQTR